MTLLPIQIADAVHLSSLLKEFTGSKTITWRIHGMHNQTNPQRPGWFRKELEYTRFERKQALIFKREEDYGNGVRTVWLMAVQPKCPFITTNGFKMLSTHLTPQGNHGKTYKGHRFEVPTLSESAIISLFEGGITSYGIQDVGAFANNPAGATPYVYLK